MRIYKHKWKNNETVYIHSTMGFCKVNIYHETHQTVAELYDLIVFPDFRGHGIGENLMEMAVEQARLEGADVLVLWPDCEKWTENWYHRLGFERNDNYRNHDGEPGLAKKL